MLLDDVLPRFDTTQATAVVVNAPVDATYQAVRSLDPDQVAESYPLLRLLGQVRAMPARMASGLRCAERQQRDGALSADEYREAFVVLDEEPGREFVVGMIGKFMKPTQLEFHPFEPGQFRNFDEPGFGKVAVDFLVQPYGTSRSVLSTETRTLTTDPRSAELFRRYWRLVGPFADRIMRRWLILAKRLAEQPADHRPRQLA
jgi:hypothetical protein